MKLKVHINSQIVSLFIVIASIVVVGVAAIYTTTPQRQNRTLNHKPLLAVANIQNQKILGRSGKLNSNTEQTLETLPVVNAPSNITSDTTWTSDSVYLVSGTTTVSNGATLTVQPGTIIKFNSAASGIIISYNGTLNSTGTSTDPIIFTSYKDDSVGGDSNGDGPSTPTDGDYGAAIQNNDGTVDIHYSTLRYGNTSIASSCYGSTTMTLNATDNTFNSGAQIVGCSAAAVTLARNQFAISSGTALSVDFLDISDIVLSGTNQNTFTGTGKQIDIRTYKIYVPAGSTSTISGTSGAVLELSELDVNGTLNFESDAIVKTDYHNPSIVMKPGGTLNAIGSNDHPVIFTSIEDDSVGGDSNGDGPTTGADSDYNYAVDYDGGTVNTSFAVFRYASKAFTSDQICGGHISFEDSTFNSGIGLCGFDTTNAVLKRNHFDLFYDSSNAVSLLGGDPTLIELSGIDSNVFTGSGRKGTVYIDESQLANGNRWTVDPNAAGVIVLYISRGITVNGTLNLHDGTIVKSQDNYSSSIVVGATGTLNVSGTLSNPVVFTSYKDDSVGGDSNGDGASSGAGADYAAAISNDHGGAVTLSHTLVRNGQKGIQVDCDTQSGSTSMTDSTFNSNMNFTGCTPSRVVLQRNQFAVTGSFLYGPINLLGGDPSFIELTGTNKNIFQGQDRQVVIHVDEGQINVGNTWNFDPSSGAKVLYPDRGMIILGTLNVQPGSVVKNHSGYGPNFDVRSGGVLNMNGSNSNPITATSLFDNSIAGNSSGNSQDPLKTDNVAYILTRQGSELNMSHLNIEYSQYGIQVDDGQVLADNLAISDVYSGVVVNGGNTNLESTSITASNIGLNVNNGIVTIRGSIQDATDKAIRACNWSSSSTCSVDAAYVDWGNVNGPTTSQVCGEVTVSPWVYGGTSHTNNQVFIPNCNNSETPDTQMNNSIANFQSHVSTKQINCNEGLQDACQAISQAFACLEGAINVAASTTPFPLPDASTAEDVNSFSSNMGSAAATFIQAQEESSPVGTGLGFLSDLNDLVGTFVTMANAYNNCAP